MPEDYAWATRTLPKFRLVPYVLYVVAGALLAIYQPPSLRDQSMLVQSLFHVVLLTGGVVAVVGVITKRERIEQSGAVIVLGPLCAYGGILLHLASTQDPPGRFATIAIGLLFLAGAGHVLTVVLDLRRELHRADRFLSDRDR